MTDESIDVGIGYRLRRVYTTEQKQELVSDDTEIPESEEDRELSFFWDWRLSGSQFDAHSDSGFAEVEALSFDVAVGVNVGPSPLDHSRYVCTVVGDFVGTIEQDLGLEKFVKLNSVAMLFPYLRQVVTNLSGWAPGETLYLPIINVGLLEGGLVMEDARGWEQLKEVPALASRLGIDLDRSTGNT